MRGLAWLALLSVTSAQIPDMACKDGFSLLSGFGCYEFAGQAMSWTDARDYCTGIGGILVKKEQNKVQN